MTISVFANNRIATNGALAGAIWFGVSGTGTSVLQQPQLLTGARKIAFEAIDQWELEAFRDQLQVCHLSHLADLETESSSGIATRAETKLGWIFEESLNRETGSRHGYSSRSYPEIIARIRSSLSLQVKELAEILHVERPTIYSWMNEQSFPTPQNRARLLRLLRVAEEWNGHSREPIGKAVREVGPNAKSLVEVLGDPELSEHEIEGRLLAIARKQSARPQRLKSVREIANQHGIDLTRVRDDVEEFDLLTGKRPYDD